MTAMIQCSDYNDARGKELAEKDAQVYADILRTNVVCYDMYGEIVARASPREPAVTTGERNGSSVPPAQRQRSRKAPRS